VQEERAQMVVVLEKGARVAFNLLKQMHVRSMLPCLAEACPEAPEWDTISGNDDTLP
jgi:hypothetical protein